MTRQRTPCMSLRLQWLLKVCCAHLAGDVCHIKMMNFGTKLAVRLSTTRNAIWQEKLLAAGHISLTISAAPFRNRPSPARRRSSIDHQWHNLIKYCKDQRRCRRVRAAKQACKQSCSFLRAVRLVRQLRLKTLDSRAKATAGAPLRHRQRAADFRKAEVMFDLLR